MLAHLTQSLTELELFIDNGYRILSERIADNDFDRLLAVMSVIQQIEQRQHNVETVFFEALHEEVAMLRNYSVELDNEIAMKVPINYNDKCNYRQTILSNHQDISS